MWKKCEAKGHAGFYVEKAEYLNVKDNYFSLVYIGFSFVEFRVFISS